MRSFMDKYPTFKDLVLCISSMTLNNSNRKAELKHGFIYGQVEGDQAFNHAYQYKISIQDRYSRQ